MPKGKYDRKGWKGNKTSFKKGLIPSNKGKRKYNIHCLNCGKIIDTSDSRRKYCSQNCWLKYEWKTGIRKKEDLRIVGGWNKGMKGYSNQGTFKKGCSGEKSPAWKGGKFHDYYIRRMPEYVQWRSDIFQRDNWTCQTCGLRGVYLEAHHSPKGFKQICTENAIKDVDSARQCMELWDTNNGVTLCVECHNLTKKGRFSK